MFQWFRRKSASERRVSGQYYERRGQYATRRIAQAVAHKSWKWTLLNLAWTVGPVTFIALNIGSYVGLGKTAANETFVYFAVYTLVAGTLAVISTILHDAFQKPKVAGEQARLLDVIDRLFNLMLATRNAMLEELEPNERRIMGAYYLLNGSAILPSAVGTAVKDMTQNEALADHARRVDVFAAQGMQSRIDDEWEEIAPQLEAIKAELEPAAPQAYKLLENRLRGVAPSTRNGIERSEGFISRILSAADAEDEQFMTLGDAYEMLTLALEMLSGRRIAMLDIRFQGDKAFERAQVNYNEAHQHYRMALRARNNRIRMLADKLYMETGAEALPDTADSISRLIVMMEKGLSQLSDAEKRRYRRYYEDEIYRRHREVVRRYDVLLRTEKAYRKVWQRDGEKLTVSLQAKSLRQNGFVIVEQEIGLMDRQKIRFAQKLDNLLGDIEIRTGRKLVVYDASDDDRMMPFTMNDYKQFAMSVAHLLDDMIDISKPEEQLAVESSNMGNFASIEMEFTAQTKAGWAATTVEAMMQNRRKASHKLARNLVRFYRIALTDEMMDYFSQHFGADRNYLTHLNFEVTQESERVEDRLPDAPYPLQSWRQLFDDPYKLAAYSS